MALPPAYPHRSNPPRLIHTPRRPCPWKCPRRLHRGHGRNVQGVQFLPFVPSQIRCWCRSPRQTVRPCWGPRRAQGWGAVERRRPRDRIVRRQVQPDHHHAQHHCGQSCFHVSTPKNPISTASPSSVSFSCVAFRRTRTIANSPLAQLSMSAPSVNVTVGPATL